MTAKRVTCGSVCDRAVKPNCLGSRVKNDAGLLVRLVPRGSCGDKIPSCRRHVQVENLHPQKSQGLPSLFLSPLSFPVATRFHLVSCGDKIPSCRRHVQVENLHPRVENLHPQFKTPWIVPVFLSPALPLVATRFHLVSSAN